MRSEGHAGRALVATALLLAALAPATATRAAAADPATNVSLTTTDGATTITGRLTAAAHGLYTVETEIGQLVLPADRMVCSGPGCPGARTIPDLPRAPDALSAAQGMLSAPGAPIAAVRLAMAPATGDMTPAAAPERSAACGPAGTGPRPAGAGGQVVTRLHFAAGSGTLDRDSSAALDRLLHQIRLAKPAEIVLLGHAADDDHARALSATLARNAAKALQARDSRGVLSGVVVRAAGVGSAAPLSCGADISAEWLNRRVEVWVRG